MQVMDIRTEPLLLSALLRERTHVLHGKAERSGFVADMLRGRATRSGYALFLRNLLPAYEALEAGLERCREHPALHELARREVYRSQALKADLVDVWGDQWRRDLPVLPAGRRYGEHVAASAAGSGEGLVAHAYVRYLGDLNGGQVLARLLAKSLDLPAQALSFYEFPQIGDLHAFKLFYREAMDRSSRCIADLEAVAKTAVEAFGLNIEVSEAVRAAAGPADGDV
jgi:heme oxygenase